MRKEDLKNWTADRLKDEIVRLDKENTDLQNSHMKLYNDTKDKIRCLVRENQSLKQRIKDLEDICDGSCFANETDDRDEKIAKMQDRIDSDCVRINRLKVTINTLVDMYGLLRNQVGMD